MMTYDHDGSPLRYCRAIHGLDCKYISQHLNLMGPDSLSGEASQSKLFNSPSESGLL